MKRFQANESCIIWYICYVLPFTVLITVACYPVQKPDIETQAELRNEKHFPNGTTIGKYTYMDKEGNPVQVKYYADEASYGVELNSIKVVDATGEPFPTTTIAQNTPNSFDTDADAKTIAELINSNRFPALEGHTHKLKQELQEFSNPYEFLNKELKTNRYKTEKPNADYDIFYQNELKGPTKCSKEKVRVYYDSKESRKIRSAANDLADVDKFCEQF
ncbi:hypothetical protein PYW07_015502 [Mythimna separata]|uniref:Uncharacterized protein n=1 Tax=Mythimna separata TaxID=271217 RepID=A0AAD8DYM3_MYTSE|nr:hypothetical protein PYW07_015502 [Mythimna separata]